MNWEQKLILRAVDGPDRPPNELLSRGVGRLAKHMGDLSTNFRLGQQTGTVPSLTGLEVHLVAAGYIAGEVLNKGDWSDGAVYDPVRAMEVLVDLYIDLVVLSDRLANHLGMVEVDLDALAVARATGIDHGAMARLLG